MKLTIVTGSRADFGLLSPVIKALEADDAFQGHVLKIWGCGFEAAFGACTKSFTAERPDLVLLLGDRYEIMAAATAAHLLRIPIAHIGGGDVTEGSYDDAMRDSISRMATVHFVTSTSAMARLSHMGLRNVHLVGNPGVDVIRGGAWKGPRPYAEPYVVVSYQAETIDGTNELGKAVDAIPLGMLAVFILPNPDRGSEQIRESIEHGVMLCRKQIIEFLPHGEFLNLLAHCDEFIGNSSAMLYEAPELGIKTRMIGKRQRGRTIPWGDAQASERIRTILKYASF